MKSEKAMHEWGEDIYKRLTMASDCGTRDRYLHTGGNLLVYCTNLLVQMFWKTASVTEFLYKHILWLSNYTPKYIPTINVWTCISRFMYKDGHSSIIPNNNNQK